MSGDESGLTVNEAAVARDMAAICRALAADIESARPVDVPAWLRARAEDFDALSIPHGTASAYKHHRCRCRICTQANTDRTRAERRRAVERARQVDALKRGVQP